MLRFRALDDGTAGLSSWSPAERLSLEETAPAEPAQAPGACTCGLSVSAGVYNEEAFRYLLGIEYKRFERSRRPFVLALIDHSATAAERQPMRPAFSNKVFAALAESLRETDVIGWYHEGSVAGALLTHLGDRPPADVSRLMSTKITQALDKRLSTRAADRLNVTLYQPFKKSWS